MFFLRFSVGFLNGGSAIVSTQVVLKVFERIRGNQWRKVAETEWDKSRITGVFHHLLVDIIVIYHTMEMTLFGSCVGMA